LPHNNNKTPKRTCIPVILLAGEGSRLKKDIPGPKGLAQIGTETLLSLQLKRFSGEFPKPIVIVRREEKISYEEYLIKTGLDATLVVDENPTGPPSSLIVAAKAIHKKLVMVIVTLGDSICTSDKILEYASATDKNNGALSVAKSIASNTGSAGVIHRDGLLTGYTPKEAKVKWRWTGTVIMPLSWARLIPASGKLLPQIVALSDHGAYFRIIKETGASANVNTITELREANRLLNG